ncbi:hypothetical protein GCM10022403_061720 [Streptomyces coacervatus]|uniref:Uncharacterized protein n=1 Tax=Streptomyces coacervatus TaxID=647381 RepID=A0ABP7IJQ0_9ACTN
MGAIVLLIGVAGLGALIAAVTVFAIARSRRNSGNARPASGTYPQNMGYPSQQGMYPIPQQPYPTATSDEGYGYPAPPEHSQQNPNPYAQQHPRQGQ